MRRKKNKGRKFKKQQKKIELLGYGASYLIGRGGIHKDISLLSYSRRRKADRENHEFTVAMDRKEPMPEEFPKGYPNRRRRIGWEKAFLRRPKYPIYKIGESIFCTKEETERSSHDGE